MKNFIQSKRQNGIEIITNQQQNLHSVCISFYFKAGILFETKKTNGISHLLEHLFFRKMDDLLQEQLYYNMESIGSTLRAETYFNFIRYDIVVSPKYFRQAFDLIFRILKPFSWEESDIQKEREVVLKQIDYKSVSFSEYMDSLYFKGTELAKPIMGRPETIKSLSKQIVQKYKDKIFNSENVCCIVTGNYSDQDYQYMLSSLDKVLRNRSSVLKEKSQIPALYCNRTTHSDIILSTDLEISDVSISFDIDNNQVSEYAVDLLCSILGEGDGSKLSLILREKFALTDEIYSRVDTYPSIKKITIEFSANNSDLQRCLLLVFEIIANMKHAISKKDLLGSITFFTTNQYQLLDAPRDLNFFIGWRHFALAQELSGMDQIIQAYEAVTVDDLLFSANNIFTQENLIISVTNNSSIFKKSDLKKLFIQLRAMIN